MRERVFQFIETASPSLRHARTLIDKFCNVFGHRIDWLPTERDASGLLRLAGEFHRCAHGRAPATRCLDLEAAGIYIDSRAAGIAGDYSMTTLLTFMQLVT
jgi:hypothetical protein